MKLTDYPKPDDDALAHSKQLQNLICKEINSQGVISFERYMEMALYAPGMGYYAAGSHKLGASGDFITAPELSSLFSRCLANQCQQILSETAGSILEFGAGSGVMAADILLHLEQLNCLPEKYLILDLSPDLKQRQQQTIARKAEHLLERVEWLHELPNEFDGVVLANEVIDAMPVSVFKKTDKQILEQQVDCLDGCLSVTWKPADAELFLHVQEIEQKYQSLPDNYISEVNLHIKGWIAALSQMLKQGAILLIDYGYSGSEYYLPERSMGTLLCHYQHQAHDDPMMLIGLQDITASVDFSAVAKCAKQNGLEISGYTTQAHFLIANGIETMLMEVSPEDEERFYQMSSEVKRLMMPSEMGERFKVLGLQKQLNCTLKGFTARDFQDRL